MPFGPLAHFPIPAAALASHMAALGKTGSGKSSSARVIVEQVATQGVRVCILDTLKSDWWGITSSADGKRPGLPFTILGGPHGHLPLHSTAGAAIGQLVGSGQLPLSVIDMSDFEPGGLHRFFCDFAPALMRYAKGVVYLVIEEAHELAPKERAGFGAENMAIHYMKKLATASRSKGIRLVLCTQRTQALHNAVLGSCETILAHRLIHPADQKPVMEWLGAHIRDKKAREEIANSMPGLPTGTAWVCSGAVEQVSRVRMPFFRTYDNTSTPTGDGDADRKVTTAAVDQDQLRAIIGDAVKEAEENDPKRLKAELAKLRKELASKPAAVVVDVDAQIQRAIHERDCRWLKAIQAHRATLAAAWDIFTAGIPKEPGTRITAPTPKDYSPQTMKAEKAKTETVRRAYTGPSDTTLSKAERAILVALVQRHPKPSSNAQLAVLSGYSPTSGGFFSALAGLRQRLYMEGVGSGNRVTPQGIAAADDVPPIPSGADRLAYWIKELPKAEGVILGIIAGAYPDAVSKDFLCKQTGYSPTSGGFFSALAKLRKLELIERGELRASDDLMGDA